MTRSPGPVEVCRADALREGDQFWSPANRWETVRTMTKHADSATALIVTDKTTRPWPLASYHEVQFIRQRDAARPVAVAVEDAGLIGLRVVVMAANAVSSAWQADHVVLAEGNHLGKGEGWAVWDRRGDELPVRTAYPSKAAARSALVRSAKAYAKALKVEYRGLIGES